MDKKAIDFVLELESAIMSRKKLLRIPVSKTLFRSTVVYTAANLLNMGIPFLLLPFLTRYLSPYEYGLVATFQAMRTIGMIAVRMGTGDAISRAYYDRDKEGFDFYKYIFNTLIVVSGMFLLLFALMMLGSGLVERKLFFPASWALVIPLVSITDTITNIPLKLWIFQQKPVRYSVFQVSKSFFDLSLSLLLVVGMGLTWKGRILGIGIAEAITMSASLIYLIRGGFLVYSLDYTYMKDILKYGVPIFFHSIGFWVIGSVDRFFLNNMVGVSTTGIYSVSYSVAGIIGLLAGSFSMAWTPVFYEKLGTSETGTKKRIVGYTYLYFIGMLVLALFLTVVAPYLLRILVGTDFYGAERYIFWIAFGSAFQAMYMLVCGYIFYSKKTYMIARVTFSVAIVNIILTYFLIKANGAMGAAQATFLSYLLSFLLTWVVGNKVYPMPWFTFNRHAVKATEAGPDKKPL